MMDYFEILSLAVQTVQGLAALYDETGKVSAIVARRFAEGRAEWTPEEKQEMLDAVAAGRAEAVAAVAKLP
jgi:hypothetical protein